MGSILSAATVVLSGAASASFETAPLVSAAAGALSGAMPASIGVAPLPADPPIGGLVWTVIIPAVLLIGSFLGTYLLYRRFAKEEEGG